MNKVFTKSSPLAWLVAVAAAIVLSCVSFVGTAHADEEYLSVSYMAQAKVEGRDIVPDEVSFKIEPVTPGAPMPAADEVSCNAYGKGWFENMKFTEPGTYAYNVTQIEGSKPNTDYDDTVYCLEIYIAEDAYGLYLEGDNGVNLLFSNKWIKPDLHYGLGSRVELEGRDIVEGEFTFCIEPVTPGAPEFDNPIVTCDEWGNFDFGVLNTADEGTYEYVMYQVVGSDPDIVYDETKVTVVLEVYMEYGEIDGDELEYMDCTSTFNGEEFPYDFRNVYTGEPQDPADEGVEDDAEAETPAAPTTGVEDEAAADADAEQPKATTFAKTADGMGTVASAMIAAAVAALIVAGFAFRKLKA